MFKLVVSILWPVHPMEYQCMHGGRPIAPNLIIRMLHVMNQL